MFFGEKTFYFGRGRFSFLGGTGFGLNPFCLIMGGDPLLGLRDLFLFVKSLRDSVHALIASVLVASG